MLPKKPRHILYALLLTALSALCTSAIANTKVYELIAEVASALDTGSEKSSMIPEADVRAIPESVATSQEKDVNSSSSANAFMFATIIQGADQEVGCSTNGLTVARFNLCGDSDDRVISLSGSHSSITWQLLGGGCTPNINDDCPNTTAGCYSTVGTGATFNLNASTIPATTGAEFRVVVDGVNYYFKVKKSTITQTFVKNDYICGVPGRIQITNLSSAYEFSVNSGSGFGPWQGPIFNNLVPGTYIVKARLKNTANTCEYPYPPITILQKDLDIDVTFVDAQCSGDTGSITVTANNVPGPFKYTLLNSAGVPQEFTAFIATNPYTFSAVGFGTYIVQVETQQCTGDPLNGIDPPRQNLDTSGNPIVIGNGLSPLDASTEVNSSFGCSTITDVDITVNTSGGAAPYRFSVNGGPLQPPYGGTTTYTVTAAGTYDFLITDSNGCTITASSNVETLLPPDVTANGINGTCSNGGAKINFTINDAKGYNISFRINSGNPWDTNPQISVPAGTYNNIEVLYQQGGFQCTIALPSVTVTNVGAITGSAVKITDRTCNGGGGVNGGQIDFVGPFSGGSGGGYVFSIDGLNFSGTTSYPNLVPGTYTPIIQDGGGCRLTLTPITILDVDPPSDIDFAQLNISCATNTSDVQLTPTSNAAITNYSIISPVVINNGGSNTFVGLSTTTSYIFQITDANNCTYTEGFTPALISSIRARVKSGGDLKVCTGASDGSGAFLIDGFANNYTYNINGGAESGAQNNAQVNIGGLGAGTYTITVTDVDSGCTDSASFDVLEPPTPLTLSGTVTPMSCSNNNLGRVVANASGGWGTNRYTLVYPGGAPTVGPKSGTTFGNLSAAGTYTLSVTDAEGCTATFNFDLTPIAAPSININTAASDFCYIPGPGATIAVTSTAGTAPLASHQYRINGGPLQASPIFSGIAPGNYLLEVVDGNNCKDNINVTINPQLRVNLSIENEIPCGGAPGQIRVVVTGGYTAGAGPKQYEVSSDNGVTFAPAVPLTSNNFLYDTNIPGTYIFRVTDNNLTSSGCQANSNSIIMDPPVNINPASHQVFPPACGEVNSGRVIITPDATSGLAPYEINFDGAGWSSNTIYSGLNEGQTYPYTVRDARGCETVPQNVTIPSPGTAPDATVAASPATCFGGAVEGAISVTAVSGGTPDFIYILQDQYGAEIQRIGPTSSTSETFSGVPVGNYMVITLDSGGCIDQDNVRVDDGDLDVVPDPVAVPICAAGGFTNTVTIVGGVGPFEIRLVTDPPGAFAPVNLPPDRHTFAGLQYGVSYTVEVRDLGTGCTHVEIIDPIDGPNLDVTASSTPGYCNALRNGQIEYNISNFNIGDDLFIEIYNIDTGTLMHSETQNGVVTIPYIGFYDTLPGNYQVVVTNLTDFCTDGALITIDQNLPNVYILAADPANCNADGQFTVVGGGGAGGPYEFAFGPTGFTPDYDGTATPADPTDDFSTTSTFGGPAGTYQVYVRDNAGCTSFDIGTIIQQQTPPLLNTPIVQNQCDPTSTAFDITVSVPNTVDTPRFTLGGDTQFGVLNGGVYEYTYTVSSPGDYPVLVEDADGCSSIGTATVYEFLSASGGFTTDTSCNNGDGVITIYPLGGSGDFDYDLTGLDYLLNPVSISQTNNPIFTGIFPGSYQVVVTDRIVNDGSGFCTFTVNNINLDAAVPPIIIANTQDISCNGANDGSVDIVLQLGTDVDSPFDYRLVDFDTRILISNNASGSFPNLVPGRYEVEVISSRNCSDLSGLLEILEPLPFSIDASAPDFTCEPGANRFSSTIITVNIVDPGTALGGYQYSITGFSNYQSGNTFEIVDNGLAQNITVYAIDGNGCQSTFDVPTINPPSDVVPTIIEIDPLNCRDDERVRIQVIGTTSFTVNTVSAVAVGPVTNTPGNNYVDVYLPASGDFLFEVQDNIGACAYPMPKHTVIEPIEPTVVISEAKPISCFGGSDGELSITVTNYTGAYTYNVYSGNDPGKITVLATGSLDTANNPEIIAGLPGGNFFVEIISSADPYCASDSNVATIRTPNGPLTVTATEIGNVSCNDNTGRIEANATGGWDSSAYSYQLWKDDGTGTYLIEVPFSAVYDFTNLTSGDYRVEVRDVQGCSALFNINLPIVPQINAGIREPQGLVCPNGNNAVLEAFDPTTGDAITAIAGATGGYPGAGYNYRLLYLNSNDNTDVASASGLQNSPTFIGASGGFISGGWYAIEVSSSFDCLFVTTPYFVNPPPPVQPKLVQTRVPGCGGMGEMRLEIENPDPLFVYEYQLFENGVPIGTYIDMLGTSVLIPGIAGITYQFDVRKKNASNTCLPVRSNGITMTDATGITLLPNLPDDISCASELDGRIESFINGGVGDNLFYLYIGDPGNAFAPNPTATLFRGPQDNGTFEGLPEGSVAGGNAYYIAVTSGVTCYDVAGPFEIIRPEPIVFDAVSAPVSCSGEADGSITVEVLSGGVGLIQFAIEPNFNEFFSDPLNPGVYVFDELAAGSYEILIQDENGCFEKDVITVTEPQEIIVTDVTTTPETCIGFEDGTAQLTITGGTPFLDAITSNPYYETKLIGPDSDGSEVFVRNDNLTFANLRGGATYVVFIQDASLCGTDTIITIDIGVDLTAAPVVQYGCEGIFPTNTVLVTMQDASLLPRLLFSLDVDDVNLADTQTTWGDLPAGDHTVYIYHENGCTNTADFTIDSYDPLTLSAVKTGANEVTASAEGGFGGYEFFFQGQSYGTDTVYTTNETGTVTIKVVDQMGCEAEVAIPFVFEGMLDIPNFFSPNGDNENDLWAPLNRELFPYITVKIYDRYGRVVAVLDQVSYWDGRYDGNELPTGDYWYVVNANDRSKVRYVGHFTLYR